MEEPGFQVERFEWLPLGDAAVVVRLTGRWDAGVGVPGRSALVAEQGGVMLAVASLPDPPKSDQTGQPPVEAVLSLPVGYQHDPLTGFRLKSEDRATLHLGRPVEGEPGSGGDVVRALNVVREEARPSEGSPAVGPRADSQRVRELERDLERGRAARHAMEGALHDAAATREALAGVRAEGERLRAQLESSEGVRERLDRELAAARASERESAEAARAHEEELAAMRRESQELRAHVEEGSRRMADLREALAGEDEARSEAERVLGELRVERDAALERARKESRRLAEREAAREARTDELERALSGARDAARREREQRLAQEAELAEARSLAQALEQWLERAARRSETGVAEVASVEGELRDLAGTISGLAHEAAAESRIKAGPAPTIEEAMRAVSRGRREVAEVERQVAGLRSALLELTD